MRADVQERLYRRPCPPCEAIGDDRTAQRTHSQPLKADYDVHVGDLMKRSWKQADLPRADRRRPVRQGCPGILAAAMTSASPNF
jgi:hypothetical protein